MELDEKTKAGIELTARQFEETLASEGVTSINPVGETFDPNTSEAIMKMPASEGETDFYLFPQVPSKTYYNLWI